MIKALILDDEINCIDTLSIILDRKFGDEIKVVAKCTSIQQAIDCMDLYNPQVVFLDVEMPNGTGFDFLLNVKKQTKINSDSCLHKFTFYFVVTSYFNFIITDFLWKSRNFQDILYLYIFSMSCLGELSS